MDHEPERCKPRSAKTVGGLLPQRCEQWWSSCRKLRRRSCGILPDQSIKVRTCPLCGQHGLTTNPGKGSAGAVVVAGWRNAGRGSQRGACHGLARSLRFSQPSIPYFSCLTGAPASDELLDGEYWVRHLANPVRFLEGMRFLLAEGPAHFIEIGPASTLLRMGQQCASNEQRRNANWIPSIGPDGSDCAIMSAGLAKVTGQGTDVDAPVARVGPPGRAKTTAIVRDCVDAVVRITRPMTPCWSPSARRAHACRCTLSRPVTGIYLRFRTSWIGSAPYAGRVTCFRARRSWIRALDLTTVGKSWRNIAGGGFEVREVAGNHYGMFRGPHLDAFAAVLEECLAARCAEP